MCVCACVCGEGVMFVPAGAGTHWAVCAAVRQGALAGGHVHLLLPRLHTALLRCEKFCFEAVSFLHVALWGMRWCVVGIWRRYTDQEESAATQGSACAFRLDRGYQGDDAYAFMHADQTH